MAQPRKVIITCAVTGSGHTPTMSPTCLTRSRTWWLSPSRRWQAGAAVIHLHARDPKDGSPTADPAVFLQYLKAIKGESDAVISITSGGGTGMSVADRLRVIYETKPELCTLNLGTFNYGSFPMIDKYQGTWQFDWEEPYLESTRTEPFVSTFADIEHMLTDLADATGAKFEYEAYDVGHLYTLAYYLNQGLVKPPIFLQTILGVMGGIGADVDHLVHMKATADKLFGSNVQWSVLGAGQAPVRHDHGVGGDGLARQGRVWRTGCSSARGGWPRRTRSRCEKIVRILRELSLEIATPDEAREILGLKGLNQVGW